MSWATSSPAQPPCMPFAFLRALPSAGGPGAVTGFPLVHHCLPDCWPSFSRGKGKERKKEEWGYETQGAFQWGEVKQAPSLPSANLFLGPQITNSSCWDANEDSPRVSSHFLVWAPSSRLAWEMTSRWAELRGPETSNCWLFQVSLLIP